MKKCPKCKSENVKIGELAYYTQIQAFCYSCKSHYHKDSYEKDWNETTNPEQLDWRG